MEVQQYTDNLTVKFEGADVIDAETLTSVLENTVKALKRIAQNNIEERYEKFVIRDIRKGSFIVDLVGILTTTPGFLPNVNSAVTIFKNALDIKKHLLGGNPSKVTSLGDKVKIENINGDILISDNITFNIYTQDSDLDDRLTNISKSIYNDSQKTSLLIDSQSALTGENDSIEISNEESKYLSKAVDLSKLNNLMVSEIIRLKARVKKIDFESNSKWQVVILGESYNVKILDEDFKARIHEYKFTKGTLLDCDLELNYIKTKEGLALNNKKEYTVIKVYDVFNEPESSQLDLFN